MKKIALLVFILAALPLCASGQTLITFSDMPSTDHPTLIPHDYPNGSYLNWVNLYYVSPLMWDGSGPGFLKGPHVRVAFMGGPLCDLAPSQPSVCYASIEVPVAPNSTASFQPIQMSLAAGWFPNNVVVTAYDHSTLVGSTTWQLTTNAKTFTFPAEWINVTQLVFYPEPVQKRGAGSVVIYTFLVYINP